MPDTMASSPQPFVLIVDDNATNLSVLSKCLKNADYKVRMAVDGEDAIAQIERNQPELILLDIEMPKMDGFETCRRLQMNPKTQGIPIIFMTALSDTEDKVKGLSLGAVDYVSKPFAEAEVLARIRVHWQLKRLTNSLEQQVHERTQALQQAQVQLVQQEKLSALGQLVAGVAHEINNPLSCILGNIKVAEEYVQNLFGLIDLYEKKFPEPGEEIQNQTDEIDLNYLREDLPKIIKTIHDSGDLINSISKNLRAFVRIDDDFQQLFDLHECINSTLLILRHRFRGSAIHPMIEVCQNYGKLPPIYCYPGQMSQVFMNLLANAIDAISESRCGLEPAAIQADPGCVTITTTHRDQFVEVSIADNGCGMSESVRDQIFDYLFTTKKRGKGTGLGLAIVHQIVVEKHGGQIRVNSTPSVGTEFIISLPIAPLLPPQN